MAGAREAALTRTSDATVLQSLGELENALATARLAYRDMLENANGYEFEPVVEHANRALISKTIGTHGVISTVHKALEVIGGGGLYRRHELERLLRDIQAAPFHPLPEKKQLALTARVALGLPPIG